MSGGKFPDTDQNAGMEGIVTYSKIWQICLAYTKYHLTVDAIYSLRMLITFHDVAELISHTRNGV